MNASSSTVTARSATAWLAWMVGAQDKRGVGTGTMETWPLGPRAPPARRGNMSDGMAYGASPALQLSAHHCVYSIYHIQVRAHESK